MSVVITPAETAYVHLMRDDRTGQIVVSRGLDMTREQAYAAIGSRVAMGFAVHTRFERDRNHQPYSVTYFQSEITGGVWAIYTFND